MTETSEAITIIQHAARTIEAIREAASDTRTAIGKYRLAFKEIILITSDPEVKRLAEAALEDEL